MKCCDNVVNNIGLVQTGKFLLLQNWSAFRVLNVTDDCETLKDKHLTSHLHSLLKEDLAGLNCQKVLFSWNTVWFNMIIYAFMIGCWDKNFNGMDTLWETY